MIDKKAVQERGCSDAQSGFLRSSIRERFPKAARDVRDEGAERDPGRLLMLTRGDERQHPKVEQQGQNPVCSGIDLGLSGAPLQAPLINAGWDSSHCSPLKREIGTFIIQAGISRAPEASFDALSFPLDLWAVEVGLQTPQ